MIPAHLTLTNYVSLVAPVCALLGALGTFIWRVSQAVATFRTEHAALMADLKARSEHLERATPGINPLPETAEVKSITEGT